MTESAPIFGPVSIPIIGVTGDFESGKTRFAASLRPSKTLLIDLEKSAVGLKPHLAKYIDFYDEFGGQGKSTPKPIEAFVWFRDLIESIEPGQYDVIVVDPITDIENGLVDWVKANPEQFGKTKKQYDSASGLLWGDVKHYWKGLLGSLAGKCHCFVFTAHLRMEFSGGRPTGRKEPKGKETLMELATLYLRLDREPNAAGAVPDKPHGKIIKGRVDAPFVEEDGTMTYKPLLPPYLQECTVAKILEYTKNPPDYAKLKKNEKLPPEPPMSDDEKLLVQRDIEDMKRETAQAELTRAELVAGAVAPTQPARETPAVAAPAAPTPQTQQTEKSHRQEIAEGFKSLGFTEEQQLKVLGKRNVTSIADLTDPQAEELRNSIWDRLTQRDMEDTVAAPAAANPT